MPMTKEEALAFAREDRNVEVVLRDIVPERVLRQFYTDGWTAKITWSQAGSKECRSTVSLVKSLMPEYWAKVQEAEEALRGDPDMTPATPERAENAESASKKEEA